MYYISIALGLRPGLLQKYQQATTADAKWQLLKAFMLDPQSLASVEIEACYQDLARQEDTSSWVEKPLSALRKLFTSDEEKRFLENKVVAVQRGRPHPQDPSNPELRLYWTFMQNQDDTKHRKDIGTTLRVTGSVPSNRAALATMAEGVDGHAADFMAGKGMGSRGDNKGDGKGYVPNVPEDGKGKGKGKTKGKDKRPKKASGTPLVVPSFVEVLSLLCCIYMIIYIYVYNYIHISLCVDIRFFTVEFPHFPTAHDWPSQYPLANRSN